MEKTDYTFFLFEMVLMWFDLSTRHGFVSHVVAHVIRLCADNPSFSSFSTVQRLCLYVRSSFSSVNIGFIWKITLEQVSYSTYIPLVRKFYNQVLKLHVHEIECKISQACGKHAVSNKQYVLALFIVCHCLKIL